MSYGSTCFPFSSYWNPSSGPCGVHINWKPAQLGRGDRWPGEREVSRGDRPHGPRSPQAGAARLCGLGPQRTGRFSGHSLCSRNKIQSTHLGRYVFHRSQQLSHRLDHGSQTTKMSKSAPLVCLETRASALAAAAPEGAAQPLTGGRVAAPRARAYDAVTLRCCLVWAGGRLSH